MQNAHSRQHNGSLGSIDRTPPCRAGPKIRSIKTTQSSFSHDKIITLKIRNKEPMWKPPTLQIQKNLQITHLLNKIKWKFKSVFNWMLMRTLYAKTCKTRRCSKRETYSCKVHIREERSGAQHLSRRSRGNTEYNTQTSEREENNTQLKMDGLVAAKGREGAPGS